MLWPFHSMHVAPLLNLRFARVGLFERLMKVLILVYPLSHQIPTRINKSQSGKQYFWFLKLMSRSIYLTSMWWNGLLRNVCPGITTRVRKGMEKISNLLLRSLLVSERSWRKYPISSWGHYSCQKGHGENIQSPPEVTTRVRKVMEKISNLLLRSLLVSERSWRKCLINSLNSEPRSKYMYMLASLSREIF